MSGAPAAVTTSLAATLQHISTISGRRVLLEQRQAEAEEQFVHRLAVAYHSGDIGFAEAVGYYALLRQVGVPGFARRWNAAMPFSAAEARGAAASGAAPNGPDGSYHGEGRPFGNDPCPPRGISVVYVLYDQDWTPLYVGSTGEFRERLKTHTTQKTFAYWRAWPCDSRAHAYEREAQMLDEVMPSLNRRREGRRTA